MGCGIASNRMAPVGLGRGKVLRSWNIKTLGANREPIEKIVTTDCNENVDEGIVEIGPEDHPFSVHYCTMAGMEFRTVKKRNCKDAIVVVHKTGFENFAVCLLDAVGPEGKTYIDYCKKLLKDKLEDALFFHPITPDEETIKEKLINIDKQICFENKLDCKTSGCYVMVFIYIKEKYFVANLGPSQCMLVSRRENRRRSKGSISLAGSEIFNMTNMSGNSGVSARTVNLATTNPTKAVAFLYRASYEALKSFHGGKFGSFNLGDIKDVLMELINSNQGVANPEELLRLTQAGGITVQIRGNSIYFYTISKERNRPEIPYFARQFRLYLNPLVPQPNLDHTSNWPGMKSGRAMGCLDSRRIGVLCRPEIEEKTVVKPFDKYFVLGTDGLWSIVETLEVVSLVEHSIVEEEKGAAEPFSIISEVSRKKCCFSKGINVAKVIAANAKYRWLNICSRFLSKADDISVVVIGIPQKSFSDISYLNSFIMVPTKIII